MLIDPFMISPKHWFSKLTKTRYLRCTYINREQALKLIFIVKKFTSSEIMERSKYLCTCVSTECLIQTNKLYLSSFVSVHKLYQSNFKDLWNKKQNSQVIVQIFGIRASRGICASQIYSRAMKTQHPNVHQYVKDILNILSQRISREFMKTKDRHHIDFISVNVKCPNVYTHAHIPTVVK